VAPPSAQLHVSRWEPIIVHKRFPLQFAALEGNLSHTLGEIMSFAHRPLVLIVAALAVLAIPASQFKSLCAAESEYQKAIAGFEAAGAYFGYSDEDLKQPGRAKTIVEVFCYKATDAKIESIRYLKGLPHLEDISVDFPSLNPTYSKKLVQQALEHADLLSKLKGFRISIDPDLAVSDAEICELSKIPMLSQLAIQPLVTVNVTDQSLACLEKLRGLRALVFCNTQITDQGLKHLGGMKRLEHVILAGTEITGEGFRHLKDLPLRRLFLVETKVNDENLKWLSHFEHLELLFLGGCPIEGSGLEYLSGLKELKRLSLSGTKIDDKALLQLHELPRLEELYLYECAITDACIPALRKLKSLKRLLITKTKITDAGRQKLSEALPGLQFE
ncbi:MAG TPA: hypothetical protein VHB99_03215, partial [Pirellulales bacterium]|nr:hypothetical protein [Pirellulales bacterium]